MIKRTKRFPIHDVKEMALHEDNDVRDIPLFRMGKTVIAIQTSGRVLDC